MLLDYINKVVQIWLLATTGISAITTTIIMTIIVIIWERSWIKS